MNEPNPTREHKSEQSSDPDETLDASPDHPADITLIQLAAGTPGGSSHLQSHLSTCGMCIARIQDLRKKVDSYADALGTRALAGDATAVTPPPAETVDSPLTTTPSDLKVSEPQVAGFGDYVLVNEIARGGMGVVYEARQQSLNRIVALKMIMSGELANQNQVDRFYKEAEAAANLDHPGIVPVYEVGEVKGQHYFTMGFVDGSSLADRLRTGSIPPKEAARYAKSIAEAVAYAHSRGVVHRDLKPGNVLISADGTLRITDFGIAKRIEEDSELTDIGQVLGTPSYMPPEQAEGSVSEVGPPSDIYSIGATLYCLLVGRPPFQAANVIETLQQVRVNDPVPLSRLNPSVPADLETICLKCLEKKPASRYETAGELADELARYLNGEPIHARPINRIERTWRWTKRKPMHAVAISAVILLAVGSLWSAIQQSVANRRTAIARVEMLLRAAPATVPLILQELDRETSLVESRLTELKNPDRSPGERLRLSLARLPMDPSELDYLMGRVEDCSYEELEVLVSRVANYGGQRMVDGLWLTFQDETASHDGRFRSGISLATLDPESSRWSEQDYQFLVGQLLQVNTLHQHAIRSALSPISQHLLEPIRVAFVNKAATELMSESAANAVVDWGKEDSQLLTDLSFVSNGNQHSILFPEIEKHARANTAVVAALIDMARRQPLDDFNEAERIELGLARSAAAITLLHLGSPEHCLEVLRIKDDPESLTQFVHGCKVRGVEITDLFGLLNRATSVTERYGILLALGEFDITEVPEEIRPNWLEHVKELYSSDPSSAIHGASGWLLRQWGLDEIATEIEQREVPYGPDRDWFTLRIKLPFGSDYSYFTFVVFQPGDYQIETPSYGVNQHPGLRTVTVSQEFAILNREVTRGEFQAATLFSGYVNELPWMKNPLSTMSAVSWPMAVSFCRGLTSSTGLAETDQAYPNSAGTSDRGSSAKIDSQGFRLPTSAEWEIACRAGMVSRYGFGCDSALLPHYCWYATSSGQRTHKPRELCPNLRGLFDMHGNVAEWCDDLTEVGSNEGGALRIGRTRVLHGGGWGDNENTCRVGLEDRNASNVASINYGFRIAFTLPQ